MNREFKFRHANEIAGVFVISAVVLFVLGIIFAGRSQGWFESRFTLKVVFDTAEGSFGLQEGAPVLVRNTTAGRVGPVLPTPEGLMGTTFVLKDRFRPFVTADSVAKIKKKFGVAGDAYVDIARGQGAVILDGAYIDCVKDEEILEQAQKMLADVQTNMMPILAKAEAIISSVASILDQVDKGQGVAGSAIGDTQLRDDVKSMVAHAEGITANAEKVVASLDSIISNEVARVAANSEILSAQVVGLMSNEVPQMAVETLRVQDELTRTLGETRRLITGIQKHWLISKYIPTEPEQLALVPSASGWRRDDAGQEKTLREDLDMARSADDPSGIRRHAYNLAVYALSGDDVDQAAALLEEIRFAGRLAEKPAASEEQLLEAELCRRAGNFERAAVLAEAAAASAREENERALYAESRILLAAVYAGAGNAEGAKSTLVEAKKAINRAEPSVVLNAAISGLNADVALLAGDLAAAAAACGQQSEQLREAGFHAGMTIAQRRAGTLYSQLGMSNSSATYYLRAAGSLMARGQAQEAALVLSEAREQAASAGDQLLTARIAELDRQLSKK